MGSSCPGKSILTSLLSSSSSLLTGFHGSPLISSSFALSHLSSLDPLRRMVLAFITPSLVPIRCSPVSSFIPIHMPSPHLELIPVFPLDPGFNAHTHSPNSATSFLNFLPLARSWAVLPSFPLRNLFMVADACLGIQDITWWSWGILVLYLVSNASFIVLICPLMSPTAFSTSPLLCDSLTGDSSITTSSVSRCILTISLKAVIADSWSLLNMTLLYPSPLMSFTVLITANASLSPFLWIMLANLILLLLSFMISIGLP